MMTSEWGIERCEDEVNIAHDLALVTMYCSVACMGCTQFACGKRRGHLTVELANQPYLFYLSWTVELANQPYLFYLSSKLQILDQ